MSELKAAELSANPGPIEPSATIAPWTEGTSRTTTASELSRNVDGGAIPPSTTFDLTGALQGASKLNGLGRNNETVDQIRALIAESADFTATLEGLGQALRRDGDRTGAVEALRIALEADAANPAIRNLLAHELASLGRDEQAEKEFLGTLEMSPALASARNGLALIYQRRGEWDAARAQFELACDSDPKNPALRNSVASTLRQLGRWEEATANYCRALEIDANFAPAHFGLGLVHRHLAAPKEALAAFEAAAKLDPQDPWSRLEAAAELAALGQPDDQLAELHALCMQFPRFAPALDRLSGALRKVGRAEEALAAATSSIECDRTSPWFRCTRAEILLELGRLAEAQTAFKETLQLQSNFGPALCGLGRLAQTSGDRTAALKFFQAAVAAEPRNCWFLTAMGEELAVAEQFDEAAAAFAFALASHANFGPAHNARGVLERRRGDAGAAAAAFEAAIAADPSNLWYRLSFASALDEDSQSPQAEAVYNEILARDANFAGAHNGLGEMHRRRGDYSRAAAAFAAAVQYDPSNVAHQLSLAGAQAALGQLEVASASYRDVLALQPSSAPALHGLGQVLAQMGDHDGALAALRSAVAADPHNVWIQNRIVAELRKLGRSDEAEQAARENVEQHPSSAVAFVELAKCLRGVASAEVVLQTLRQALARDPANANLECEVASECLRQCLFAEAERLYDSVIAKAPRLVDAWIGKGLVARLQGETNKALTHFATAVRLCPSIATRAELAQVHIIRRDFAVARDLLHIASDAQPIDRDLLMQLGRLERTAGNRTAAAAAFARVRALHPRFASACVEGHHEALALGRTTDALNLLGEALLLEPADVGALEALAQVLQRADREPDALAVFKLASRTQPTAAVARLGEAGVAARLGRLDRALTIIRSLRAVWGARPEFFIAESSWLQASGLYEDAARALDDGMTRLSDLPILIRERAALAIQCGDLELAERLIDRLQAGDSEQSQTWLRARLAAARWQFTRAVDLMREIFAFGLLDPERLAFAIKVALAAFHVDAAEEHLRAHAAINNSTSQLRGQPSHPMESHYGHLLWEWRLENKALERTRLAMASARDAVSALLDVVREYPNYTPAAIALMGELRRSHRFASADETRLMGGARRIPKRFAQYWDYGELPPDLARYVETWRDNNPAYELNLFSARSAIEWLQARQLPDAVRAFGRTREPAQRANLFRLIWLAEVGGFWANIDSRCVAPIELIVRGGRDLVAYQEDIGYVGDDFLGAAPNHPLILTAVSAAVSAINRRDSDITWLSTGPGLLARTFAASAAADLDAFLKPSGPLILERRELYAAVRTQCSAAYKHTPKHWLRKGLRQNAQTFSPKLDQLLTLVGLGPQTNQRA